MTKTFCDRCEREFSGNQTTRDAEFYFKGRRWQVRRDARLKPSDQDLCEGCVAALLIQCLTPIANFKNGEPTVPPFAPPPMDQNIEKIMLHEAIDKMVAETYEKVESLTREQFKDALIYAIESGDFQRQCVVEPRHPGVFRQTVTYVPFRRVVELEKRIKELEKAYMDDV